MPHIKFQRCILKHFNSRCLPPTPSTSMIPSFLPYKSQSSLANTTSQSGYLIKVASTPFSFFRTTFNILFILFQGGGLSNIRNQVSKPSDLFSFSHVRNAARLEDSRIGALRTASTSEQGLRGTVDEQVGSWQRARAQERYDSNSNHTQAFHPRIGIGLPMSYIYATCVMSFAAGICHSYGLHCSATSGAS